MGLAPGTSIGHYDVTSLLGEGGMGQVWQATDTQLNRQVALKILPDAFAADPDRLARFTREAQILASLNHPNIAAIHGIEEAEGTRALVLELVEGATLADRIAKGPIPLDEALPIAKQIAEALEAAHEAGVIHRDLKPTNIKVRDDGTVKVLDFGLAKALVGAAEAADLSQSPTMTATMGGTREGVILGTAAYMSPEQARGKPVDKRGDIWSFGCVLFEMLTGRSVFGSDTLSDTIAKVLEHEPQWKALPAETPSGIRKLLQRCLDKSPAGRLHDVADARLEIADPTHASVLRTANFDASTLRVWQRPALALVGAALLLVVVTGAAVWVAARPQPEVEVLRLSIVASDSEPLRTNGLLPDLAVSPDGRQVVYYSTSPTDGNQLRLRQLDRLVGSSIQVGVSSASPFFSPDGQWVGSVDASTGTVLRKVSVLGGPAVMLTEQSEGIRGASWGADDEIVLGASNSGLFQVAQTGGTSAALTTLDREGGEVSHTWPFIIPDRGAVLFVTSTGLPLATGQLAVLDVATKQITKLDVPGVAPHYVSTGHIVYASSEGSIRAVPFDLASLAVTGNPVTLVEGILVKESGAADFDVSNNGRLVLKQAQSPCTSHSTK